MEDIPTEVMEDGKDEAWRIPRGFMGVGKDEAWRYQQR